LAGTERIGEEEGPTAPDLAKGPATIPCNRMLLEAMATAKFLDQVQIINGLVPGRLVRALREEHVGTIIRSAIHSA
jgi:molybdenum storage protein